MREHVSVFVTTCYDLTEILCKHIKRENYATVIIIIVLFKWSFFYCPFVCGVNNHPGELKEQINDVSDIRFYRPLELLGRSAKLNWNISDGSLHLSLLCFCCNIPYIALFSFFSGPHLNFYFSYLPVEFWWKRSTSRGAIKHRKRPNYPEFPPKSP